MKVIIAGSRTFNDYDKLVEIMDSYHAHHTVTEVVCGEAQGADKLGRRWAEEREVPVKSFPAKWNLYGRKAGFLRNEEMAKYADALVAFWDGESPGTKHMIECAKKRILEVTVLVLRGAASEGNG